MSEGVRIDKWLWAARFFKTRSLAQQAVEGGKVHLDGQRVKASKPVRPGMTVELRQGYDQKTVIVQALAEKRGSAKEAVLLYQETPASLQAREAASAKRRAENLSRPDTHQRPNKKDRRELKKLKGL